LFARINSQKYRSSFPSTGGMAISPHTNRLLYHSLTLRYNNSDETLYSTMYKYYHQMSNMSILWIIFDNVNCFEIFYFSLVEARGIEPLSEGTSIKASTGLSLVLVLVRLFSREPDKSQTSFVNFSYSAKATL